MFLTLIVMSDGVANFFEKIPMLQDCIYRNREKKDCILWLFQVILTGHLFTSGLAFFAAYLVISLSTNANDALNNSLGLLVLS